MIYNIARDRLDDIDASASVDLRWLLLSGTYAEPGYVYDPTDEFVADLTPGTHEITHASYARLALSAGARVVNNTLNRVEYTSAHPNFGTMDSDTEPVNGIVLYEHVTTDADSLLVGYWPITTIYTADVDPFVVFFTNGIIAYIEELAS